MSHLLKKHQLFGNGITAGGQDCGRAQVDGNAISPHPNKHR
jgi:hypothetical protein